MSTILFLSSQTRNQFGLQRAFRQSGRQAGRQVLNRTEQSAIHMDQVDRLSINGLPLESKTPAQAREELLGEIRIPAAIQVSLYVFPACYSSIFLPHCSQPETESLLWGDLYACIMYWVESIVDRFLEYNWVSVKYDAHKDEIWFGWKDWLCVNDQVLLSLFGRVEEECLYIAFVVVQYCLFTGNWTEMYEREGSSAEIIYQMIGLIKPQFIKWACCELINAKYLLVRAFYIRYEWERIKHFLKSIFWIQISFQIIHLQ